MPSPLLVPFCFLAGGQPRLGGERMGFAVTIFREDSFDPITLIRRGRVFTQEYQTPQPYLWRVNDPIRQDLKSAPWADGLAQEISLLTYSAAPLIELRPTKEAKTTIVAMLGNDPFVTFWHVVHVEGSIGGPAVVTLKSVHSFGDLPRLLTDRVPEDARQAMRSTFDGVQAAINRLGSIDVIDRCRAALTVVFGTLAGDRTKDLGDAITAYSAAGAKEDLCAYCGKIVARLHSRGKPNEQLKHGLRAPSDADAQLAVRCLGLVLVEKGWAN